MIYNILLLGIIFQWCVVTSIYSNDALSVTLQSSKKKESSITELKENIGSLYDEVNDSCLALQRCYSELLKVTTQCNETISSLLRDNAELQQSISKQVKLLIENKKPYKKATRIQLNAKIGSLNSCKERLAHQRNGWEEKIKLLSSNAKKIIPSDLSSYGLSCHNELSTIQKSSLFTEESI